MQKWVQAILHRARAERAHVLDLGNCGLASFPEQVFDLPDLEVLVLGPRYYVPGKDAVVQSANHGPTNTIPELPDDLQHLPNLRSLSLADNPITTIEPLRHAHRLVQLDISSTRVSRIDCLAALPQLTHLSLGSYYATMPFVRAIQTMPHHFREGDGITKLFPPPVADLTVLAMLSGLVVLDLSLAAKPDLVRLLRDLKSLRDLDLTGVDLQELGDLPSARALERMILDLTAISDVSSIAHLAALKELSLAQCSLDRVDAIARLTNLDRLNLLGFVGDLRPLTTLPHLTELTLGHERLLDYTSMRQPNDGPAERATLELSPLTSLASLEALTLRCIRHVDIYPIALLPNLSRLVIDECGVDHVNALGAATGLTALTLEDSGIDDISVLQDLSLLKYLRLDRNPIADLSPLSHLNSLQDLSVRRTHALDLSPISGLLGLEHLDVSETPLADLSAITALHALTTLSFDQTKVTDISVVSLFDQLKTLSLRNTAVADIGPVASLQQLEVLNIHACPMVDLQPLAEIPHLRRVDAGYCKLSFYPRYLLSHPRLYSLSLAGNPITDCPPEIFGHQLSEDNLAAARAHFADLEHGQTEDRELKLLILGNGRVGKTSLLRRLVHGTFDPDEESTHGIRTETWDLAVDGAPVRLNIWDFGGQDIYFGTHALFQSSGTIFLIVWDAATEQAPFHEHGALRFENRPLSFWIEYVEHLRPGAQVVIIENKCDGRRSSPLPADPRGKTTLGFSARTGHGAGTLTEWLRDTCQAELGASRQIGVGRHAVKTTIRSLQLADDRRPPAERQHRLMAYDDFLALCAAQTGRVSSSSALLTYLCDSGVLFHRDDLFDRQIILDQRWALDAIYALFDRQHCYRQLLDRGGRFRRTDLHDLVWHDLLSVPEQRLILSFMASCALAFEGDTPPGEEPVYIAPELLPELHRVADTVDLLERARAGQGSVWYRYEHRFIHQGVMRRFMASVGRFPKRAHVFWRDGVIFEARRLGAIARVTCKRQHAANPASGVLTIQIFGADALQLLDLLLRIFRKLHPDNAQVRELVSLDGEDWVDVAKLIDAQLTGWVASEARHKLPVERFRFLRDYIADARATSSSAFGLLREKPVPDANPEPAANPGEHTLTSHAPPDTLLLVELPALLVDLLDSDELRRLLRCMSPERLDQRLPESCSPMRLAEEAVELLHRRGLIDHVLFARLQALRPQRAADIDALARRLDRVPPRDDLP